MYDMNAVYWQDPKPWPYLAEKVSNNYDISLEVLLFSGVLTLRWGAAVLFVGTFEALIVSVSICVLEPSNKLFLPIGSHKA